MDGIGLYLMTETVDPGGQVGVVATKRGSPHLLEEVGCGNGRTTMPGQRLQELPFRPGEVHGLALPAQGAPAKIYFQVADENQFGQRGLSCPPDVLAGSGRVDNDPRFRVTTS